MCLGRACFQGTMLSSKAWRSTANFSASGSTNSASQQNPLECLLGHTASEIKLDISNLADAKNAKPRGKARRWDKGRQGLCFPFASNWRGCKHSSKDGVSTAEAPQYPQTDLHLLAGQPHRCQWEKQGRGSEEKDGREVPHAACLLRQASRISVTSYLWSILSIFWCDFCLFMDHYFGHWHVGVLLFGFFNCLSQSLSPGNHRRAETKRR